MGPRSYRYFTEFTFCKAFLYLLALLYVSIVSVLSILQPIYLDICKNHPESLNLNFENPGYDQRICTRTRARALLYLTPEECSFGRRIVIAAFLGGLIGWERRSADRPAGIRTMSLVSLGACLFSICSAFAFIQGPMNWDGSRVAATIPSGVGFLGAGIIWKQVNKEQDGHTVHGLTTAASVWLSAAVGIACSGELYFAASFSVAVMLLMLRFGPRLFESDDDRSQYDGEGDRDAEVGLYNGGGGGRGMTGHSTTTQGNRAVSFHDLQASTDERQSLIISGPISPTNSVASKRYSEPSRKPKKPSLME